MAPNSYQGFSEVIRPIKVVLTMRCDAVVMLQKVVSTIESVDDILKPKKKKTRGNWLYSSFHFAVLYVMLIVVLL